MNSQGIFKKSDPKISGYIFDDTRTTLILIEYIIINRIYIKTYK